jgi:hypothetical protein
MYATCLFCNAPFEKNESLEAFPVGRRLAFDAAKGRLWVVCRKCERWSLSPLDERWEAIEQAERLYRDTRKRVATDNIGLAKVSEGTTLIRIGEPMRPEFAAWRYGDQFGRRRQRQLLATGGGMVAVGALIAGGATAGIGVGGMWILMRLARNLRLGRADEIVAKIRVSGGALLEVRRKHLGQTVMSSDGSGSMVLDLRFRGAKPAIGSETINAARFEGAEAQRIAAILLPKVNRFGGNKTQVAEAVREIESMGTPERFVAHVAKAAHDYTRNVVNPTGTWSKQRDFANKGLFALPAPQRLALEMALHEETERRALEGELAALELAWRDAEEIAAIADNLTVPETVSTAREKLKKP